MSHQIRLAGERFPWFVHSSPNYFKFLISTTKLLWSFSLFKLLRSKSIMKNRLRDWVVTCVPWSKKDALRTDLAKRSYTVLASSLKFDIKVKILKLIPLAGLSNDLSPIPSRNTRMLSIRIQFVRVHWAYAYELYAYAQRQEPLSGDFKLVRRFLYSCPSMRYSAPIFFHYPSLSGSERQRSINASFADHTPMNTKLGLSMRIQSLYSPTQHASIQLKVKKHIKMKKLFFSPEILASLIR